MRATDAADHPVFPAAHHCSYHHWISFAPSVVVKLAAWIGTPRLTLKVLLFAEPMNEMRFFPEMIEDQVFEEEEDCEEVEEPMEIPEDLHYGAASMAGQNEIAYRWVVFWGNVGKVKKSEKSEKSEKW